MAKTKDEVEKGVEKESQGEGTAKEPVRVRVNLDTPVEKIVQFDSEGAELVWDADSIPDLEETVIRKLSYENAKRYFPALAEAKRRRVRKMIEKETGAGAPFAVRDLLKFQTKKLKVRGRRGWYQTWVRGDQFDDAVTEGNFVQVRKCAKEHPAEKPGEETGEVLKIKEGEDRFLIAVECPDELWEQHLRAMSYLSHQKYAHDQEETFRAYIDKKNSETGSKREVYEVQVENEEVPEKHGVGMGDEEEEEREAAEKAAALG
jgi:hypothetical protein